MFVISAFAFSLTGPAAATTGSHLQGIRYAYTYGTFAMLVVSDPGVEGTFAANYYTSSLIAHSTDFSSFGHFLQVGWAEVGWDHTARNQQRVYVRYQNKSGQSTWIWHPEFKLWPGHLISVKLDCCYYPNGLPPVGRPHWAAWIWVMARGWHQLALIDMGFEAATLARQEGDLTAWDVHFALPNTPFFNSELCVMAQPTHVNCTWTPWTDTRFRDTSTYVPDPPYETQWPIRFRDWYIRRQF